MEFLHTKNDMTMPVDSIRVNWFYRPKDMGRKSQDTRMLFATMHSDISPLNTLRGKCTVRHKAEITNVEEYRKSPDCFWWDKMYDRYIQKNYDAIPTSQIINVPERVKKVLDERWKYILVEQGRGKELTSAVKSCKRCNGYCARYVPKFISRHHLFSLLLSSFLLLLFPRISPRISPEIRYLSAGQGRGRPAPRPARASPAGLYLGVVASNKHPPPFWAGFVFSLSLLALSPSALPPKLQTTNLR